MNGILKNAAKWGSVVLAGIVVTAALSAYLDGAARNPRKAAHAKTAGTGHGATVRPGERTAAQAGASRAGSPASRNGKARRAARTDAMDSFTPAEREQAERLDEALDAEDSSRALALAAKLLKSGNARLREHVVVSLGWLGEDALAELTPLMADPDPDVAEAATSAWQQCLSEVESDRQKLQIAALALGTIDNRETLDMVGFEFASAATSLIDDIEDADKAAQARTEVVQAIVDLIASETAAISDAGREIYEDVTGNKWISLEEAERYLRDPDDYEPVDAGEQDA